MVSKRLLAIVFSAVSLQISAQLSLGVRTGFTRAWERYGDVDLPDNAVIHVNRFYASAAAYLPLNKFLSIGIEPGYTQRGAACIPGWNPIFIGDTRLYLNYIELPVLVSFKLPLYKERVSAFGKLGWSSAVLVSAIEEAYTPSSGEVRSRRNLPIGAGWGWSGPQVRRLDHGLHGGFGAQLNLGTSRLTAEARYYHGLVNAEFFNTSKNRSVHFGVGYALQLRPRTNKAVEAAPAIVDQ